MIDTVKELTGLSVGRDTVNAIIERTGFNIEEAVRVASEYKLALDQKHIAQQESTKGPAPKKVANDEPIPDPGYDLYPLLPENKNKNITYPAANRPLSGN
jgi:hypothetical protein